MRDSFENLYWVFWIATVALFTMFCFLFYISGKQSGYIEGVTDYKNNTLKVKLIEKENGKSEWKWIKNEK